MAADLAAGPSSGIPVYSCGDAHLSNFGIYAAPDRALIFDLNDFDETAMAPAEWDLKRLVTSGIVGGRHAGYSEKVIRKQVAEVLASYRRGLQDVLDMGILDRYYLRFEPERYNARAGGALAEVIARTTRQARKRTSKRVFGRIMEERPDGSLRLRENPPVLRHLKVAVEDRILATFREYLTTVPPDVALVLSHFKVTDIAQRVVGVGSVGTRCYLVIMTGPCGTPLVMQVKEAGQSVLESYGAVPQSDWMHRGISERGEGARVVAGQQVLQASSDVFLGALRWDGRDYYVRQFHDMKGSVDTEIMSQREFGRYVSACALVLARAHAQSRNATVWAGYIGKGGAFDTLEFSRRALRALVSSYVDVMAYSAADVPVAPVSGASPVYDRPAEATPRRVPLPASDREVVLPHGEALLRLLGSPDLASKRWIWEQYDHMVMGDTVQRPGGDAAVVRVHGTGRALALTTDCTPRYCFADPYEGGKQAVAECWRNLCAVGAEPIALTDNLNQGVWFARAQPPQVLYVNPAFERIWIAGRAVL